MIYEVNNFCDVPWWERLKSEEEKDRYCQEKYGVSFAEWWGEVMNPTTLFDPKTNTFYSNKKDGEK